MRKLLAGETRCRKREIRSQVLVFCSFPLFPPTELPSPASPHNLDLQNKIPSPQMGQLFVSTVCNYSSSPTDPPSPSTSVPNSTPPSPSAISSARGCSVPQFCFHIDTEVHYLYWFELTLRPSPQRIPFVGLGSIFLYFLPTQYCFLSRFFSPAPQSE